MSELNPTAPPTAAPASDEEISRHKHCHRICDGSERCVCGHELSGVTHYALVARIEADRAENDRLRARVAELKEVLKAAIGHCDCLDYNGKALIPCTEANPCAGCYMAAQIRAALKLEPR